MNTFLVIATLELALGGMVFLLGFIILRENPRQKLNRAVAFMLFFGGLGSILGALGLFASAAPSEGIGTGAHELPGEFSYLWEFFFPTLFLFASIFPRERGFVRRIRGFEILIFLPHAFHFVLLLIMSLVGPDADPRDLNVPDMARPIMSLVGLAFELFLTVHRSLFSLVNLGYGVASAALLVDSYRHARVPRLREQLRVIGVGIILGLSLYSLSSSIPVLLGQRIDEWVQSVLSIAALTLISGAIAYSMVRYKFLDTKLLARRGILYALASAILVGLYLGVVVQLKQIFTAMTGIDGRVFEPVLLIIALILFQPAISRLEDLLERFFIRDPGDYRNVLRRLGRDLLTDIELDEMLSRSIRTVAETLMLRTAYVAALGREGALLHAGAGRAIPAAALPPLGEVLERLDPAIESFRLYGPEEVMAQADRAYLVNTFHAAIVIPLRSKGETVGTLLLGDKLTGTEYTSEDVQLLSDLAAQMSISVQNGFLLRDRVAVVRIEEELNLARRIQSSFLPSTFPVMKKLDVHAVNSPSREVGGDFYDLVPSGDGCYYLAIADVSGKGVPAALLTSMLQASLRTQAEGAQPVSQILTNINSLVYRSTTLEQFATFFLARVDENSLHMSFSNAGHNYPVLCRRGENRMLERGGMIVGIMEGTTFEEESLELEPGDRVILYTDGISEAMDRAGEEFGEERICELVRGFSPELTAREMIARILAELEAFLDGVEPQDDVTLMVLRVLEPTPVSAGIEAAAVTADAQV